MKKILLLPLLFFGLLLFSGCPYSSEVAIDEPSVMIDERILGKWESKNSQDYLYTIAKIDKNNYSIEKRKTASDEVTLYRAFLSVLDSTRFLNIYEDLNVNEKTYYFYKFEVSSSVSRITLTPVTENIDEQFHSSKELKEFFKKNMKNSYFFDKNEEVYIRAD